MSTDTDRGFLHDVRLSGTEDGYYALIERVEEVDGHPDDDGVEVISVEAESIPGFDLDDAEQGPGRWYFETDPDLPQWLADWAGPIIEAYEPDEIEQALDRIREHEGDYLSDAEWLAELARKAIDAGLDKD